MFSRPFDRMGKTIGFRLTVWYTAVFAGSFLVLFAFAYFYLWSSIRTLGREQVQMELDEYAVQFQRGGIEGLRGEVEFDKHASGRNPFLVRLAGPGNETLFLNLPDGWKKTGLRELEERPADSDREWFRLRAGGGAYEMVSLRLGDGYRLQLGQSTKGRGKLLRRFHARAGLVIAVAILLSFGGGMFFASRTLRPLRRLVETLRSIIETGRIDIRAPAGQTGDELDTLATLFNALLEKIKVLIAGMQSSLDHVAHDLRTPLMRLRGIAETAVRTEQDPQGLREALMDSLEESERIASMLNTLMDISEADAGTMKLHPEEVRLLSLFEEVMDLYHYVAEEKDLRVTASCAGDLSLTVDRNRMRQVLSNLLDNAVKYTPPGGSVDVSASRKPREIVIVVRDSGIGIPPEDLPKVWDRLYRGDKSRSERGVGLGLSLVKAVVQAHRGRVDVTSRPGGGSTFSVHLPQES